MNKAELVAAVAEKTGFTKKDAEVAINAMVASIEDASVSVLLKQDRERQDREETRESRKKLLKSKHPKLLFSRQAKL